MRRKFLLIPLIVAALAGAAVYSMGWFHRDPGLQGSGTVEARDIRVGSKVGGRIDKILVREGESVEPGQLLISFDDKELLASLDQSRAAAEKAQRGFRLEEIAEARAAAAQAKAEYDQRKNGYRQEDIAAAKADLDRANADEVRTHLDFQRYDALAAKDLVSRQQLDTAEANWKMALAQRENAQHKLDEFHKGYRPEEIAAAEARYRQTEATLEKYERGNRREDVVAAKAALAYDEARFRERQVLAPAAATVEVFDARPGDLSPSTRRCHATLARSDHARIYIPETRLSRCISGRKRRFASTHFPDDRSAGWSTNQPANEISAAQVQTREDVYTTVSK